MEEVIIRENLVNEEVLRDIGNQIASGKCLERCLICAVVLSIMFVWNMIEAEYFFAALCGVLLIGVCLGTVLYSKSVRNKIAKRMRHDLGERELLYDVYLNDEGIGVGICGRNERANYIPFEMIKTVVVTRGAYTLVSHSQFYYVIRKDRIDSLEGKKRERVYRILRNIE